MRGVLLQEVSCSVLSLRDEMFLHIRAVFQHMSVTSNSVCCIQTVNDANIHNNAGKHFMTKQNMQYSYTTCHRISCIILTTWQMVFVEKASHSVGQETPCCYGKWMFIHVFTKAHHWTLYHDSSPTYFSSLPLTYA